jgi:hypothetical protein
MTMEKYILLKGIRMKEKILAVVILILVVGSVVANAIIINRKIETTIAEVEKITITESNTKNQAEAVFENFLEREHYISLTVSHEDLMQTESDFADMIGCLAAGDTQGALTAKYRLLRSLEHLRRLSGFNIDSII